MVGEVTAAAVEAEAAADMEAVVAVAEAVEAVEAIVTDLLSQEWSRIAIALALRRGLFIAPRSALRYPQPLRRSAK